MKKMLIILTALFLFGCASQSEIQVPSSITYHNKQYILAGQQDLGIIARYVFLNGQDSLKDWRTEIEVLFDRNPKNLSLKERINLRKNIYKNNNVAYFDLNEKHNALYSTVIYSPSEQYNDWQVNVAKGKNITNCGFIQYQYSLKIAKNKKLMNMKKAKIIHHIKNYVIDKELERLNQTHWDWYCNK